MRLTNLREAISILLDYVDEHTHLNGVEDEMVYLAKVDPETMHVSDVSRLTALGFVYDDESGWYGLVS